MPHYLIVHEANARCETCGKKWDAKNAQAVGAIHSRKHKHRVIVEVTQCYMYDNTKSEKEDHDGTSS